MLAMLIIIVTLLLAVVTLILTAPTHLVPVAAIRTGLNKAEIGADRAAWEIKREAEEATERALRDMFSQGWRLESDIKALNGRMMFSRDSVSIEEVRSLMGRANTLMPKLIEAGYAIGSLSMLVEGLALELSRSASFETSLAEIRDAVKNELAGTFPVPAGLLDSQRTQILASLSRLPIEMSALIEHGMVSITKRGPLFPVTGTWVHCLPMPIDPTGRECISAIRSTMSLNAEICVTIAGDEAFASSNTTLALILRGTVVDYYNANVASSPADDLGRRIFRCASQLVDSEGWLVPANAEVLGLMVGNGHSAETLETLINAGYNVVVSNDTAATAQILSEMSRESRGTLVQGNFVSGRYRLADELRPTRHDRPACHY